MNATLRSSITYGPLGGFVGVTVAMLIFLCVGLPTFREALGNARVMRLRWIALISAAVGLINALVSYRGR